MSILRWACLFVRAMLADRAQLAAENLALRQQVAVLKHRNPRPKVRRQDRIFWVLLSRLWAEWRSVLLVVKPDTVVRWHREGFKLYWRWKSSMVRWGAHPHCGLRIAACGLRTGKRCILWALIDRQSKTDNRQSTREQKPPSPTWRTFLVNHVEDIAAIDFFTVPTATFRVLFCCLVLRHARRRVIHVNGTAHPTAAWTAQQVVEAFPYDTAPRFLIHDQDAVYGDSFRRRVPGMGIHEVRIAPQAPGQNPYVERLIGSLRRDCLDHVLVLGEAHLRRILTAYLRYYHEARPHLALARNAPVPRPVESPSQGKVIAIPHLGGLHHQYARAG